MRRTIGSLVLASLAFFFAMEVAAQVNLTETGFEGLADRLRQEGWKEVAPGVLQRHRPGRELETVAFGKDGLSRALQELRHRFAVVLKAFENNPTAESEKALDHLRQQMEEMEKTISALDSKDPSPVRVGCNISFGCSANAYPIFQGVGADSFSYFVNDCSYSGTVYADSYGYTNSGSSFQWNSLTGSSVSRSASISVPGGASCFSDAYSNVYASSLGINYSCYQSYSCPPPPQPLNVDLYGPNYVYVYGTQCVTEYWSASASGGTPPYDYSWSTSYGSGSGSSFSITFCGWGSTYTDNVYVSVTATDAASGSDSASMTTTVEYQGDGCEQQRLPWCQPNPY